MLQNQRGQIGVIILLIMSVVLTVGLSLAANTNKDVVISQQEADTSRVFNAAEAGVEKALSGDFGFAGNSQAGTVDLGNDVAVNYDITKTRTIQTRLFEGLSVTVDLTGVPNNRNLMIDWSKENNCTTQDPASLIIAVFFDDAGVTRVRYQTVRGCDRGDGFTAATNINEDGYRRQAIIPLGTNPLFARVKTVYNDTHIRIQGSGWNLPIQGHVIRSEAKNDQGNETRIVEVNRTLPGVPSIMDYALFSGTYIIK